MYTVHLTGTKQSETVNVKSFSEDMEGVFSAIADC